MSGYRPGYSEAHSPYYDAGRADGKRDAQIVTSCPRGWPLGMDSERSWSHMYQRGYNRVFDAAVPHCCTAECRQKAAS